MWDIIIVIVVFCFGVWVGMQHGGKVRDWLRDKLRSAHQSL